MRHTRRVAVLLVVTATLVAPVMAAAGSSPAAVTLMLALSSAPLAGLWATGRPWSRTVTGATFRTAVTAVLLAGLGFVIAQGALVVSDLARPDATLRGSAVAAAAVVTLSTLFLMLLASAGTATVPVLRPAEAGRWIRGHGAVVTATALVAIFVLVVIVTAETGPRDRGSAVDADRTGTAVPPTIAPAVIQSVISQVIPDPVLRACVSAAAETGTVSAQGLPGLIRLSCPGSDSPGGLIHTLEGLQHLTSLETLDLRGNAVRELSPLAGLTRLQTLNLSENRITEVHPLAGMPRLDRLTLTGNRITDPRSLQALPQLTMLNIAGNRITEAVSLVGCAAVEELWIGGNPLTDVAALQAMPSLLGVDLEGIDPSTVTGVQVLRDKGVYVGGLA